MTIADNWNRVSAGVAAAARRAGRNPETVRIVIASKTKSVEQIAEVIAAGGREFGENYVQEAAAKIPALRGQPIRWHLIGHLQRNKGARAAELFDVVQTVDSAAIAAALARRSEQLQRTLSVMIEVNLAEETAKSGISPDGVARLADQIQEHRSLRLDGLMAIPPVGDSPDASRPYFRQLRELRDHLAGRCGDPSLLAELSMGMSDDYEVAVEEGATIVRIGRAILGDR